MRNGKSTIQFRQRANATLITEFNRKIINWLQCLNRNRAMTVPDTAPNGIEFGAVKARLMSKLSPLGLKTDMQTDAISHNIVACCWGFWPTVLCPFTWAKKFDRFQTIRNKSQQVPTLLRFHANGRNMLGPAM